MSVQGRNGAQLEPDDWNASGMTVDDSEAGDLTNRPVVVHYGTLTARHTVGTAAARLGITPADYWRGICALVKVGHLVPRPGGEYDAEGFASE